ncbi:inositol monophosphatase 2-like [Diabrotica undecimpunctata]|uniref:inositol monophosphatase 2-like n=1 Tax=Diabrotica undecimpunctata TaxID=50387 RepID=UPI003B63201C
MSAEELDQYYETAVALGKQLGAIIKETALVRNKSTSTKLNRTDLVTDTDKQIEKLLISTISQEYPNHKVIGEESTFEGAECTLTDAPTWIVDPIDGTMNFVHSFPHSCISIAVFVNKEPEIGIIYNPHLEQFFSARRGKGAFLNGKPISVSNTKSMADALVLTESFARKDSIKEKVILENYKMLMRETHGVRSLGSAAMDMCMIACGAADAFYQYKLNIWDIAAGELIVKEAGGVVLDTDGSPLNRFAMRVLTANSEGVAQAIAKKLVQYDPITDQ